MLGTILYNQVIYTPTANFSGSDSFTFKAHDGTVDSDTATVSITVNAVDPPSFDAIANQNIDEDASAQNVFITSLDPGTATLSATSSDTSIIPNPSVSGAGATRTLTYTPVANANGAVTITVTADNEEPEDNIFSRTFTITVNPVNGDAPTLTVTSPNGGEKWSGTYAVTWTATDPDGDISSIDVKYSANSGEDWTHIAFPPNSGSYSVNTTLLAGEGNQYLIRVIASDGTNTVQDDSNAVFTVDNTAPIITLNGDFEVTFEAGSEYFEPGATATDAIDGDLTFQLVVSIPADINAVGDHTITYDVTDSSGNAAEQVTRTVHVVDTTSPEVTVPADILGVEATDSSGAVVSFDVTATDNVDDPITASCDYNSGDSFPIGFTAVTCIATDSAGNSGSASFTIEVVDTTPPEITAPETITAEATGSLTIVDILYGNVTVIDLVDPSPILTNDALGSFPVGTTTVTWTATDASGNSATAMQDITIQDTTPPEIDVHNDVTKTTSVDSAIVDYTLPAIHDLVDGDNTAICNPNSGDNFLLGDTIVICSATDSASNAALDITFTVHVLTAPILVYVDDDFSENSVPEGRTFGYDAFSTIQDGINSVAVSGTVNVEPGTYYESLTIDNKPLSLIGPGINAENTASVNPGCDYGLTIQASSVNVQGFYFYEYDDENGEYDYCSPVIRVNGIYDADTGDYISDATGVTITENDIAGGYRGIVLRYDSSNSIISNNVLHDNNAGIKIGGSNDNTISGNEIYSNDDGILFDQGGEDLEISGNVITSNNIHDNYQRGIYSSSGITFTKLDITDNSITGNDEQGVYFDTISDGSEWLTLSNNEISDNYYEGVYIQDVINSNINISGNNITGNGENPDEGAYYGIYIYSVDESSQVNIDSNNISENSGTGIYLDEGVKNINITNNDINNNGDLGIYFYQITDSNDILEIKNNEIKDNAYEGIYIVDVTNSEVNISGNIIMGNGVYDGGYNGEIYGLYIHSADENSQISIDSNNISENSGPGIYLDYDGERQTTNINITNNDIMNNNKYGDSELADMVILYALGNKAQLNKITTETGNVALDNQDANQFNAEYNYWGTDNQTEIENLVIGNVSYSPYYSTEDMKSFGSKPTEKENGEKELTLQTEMSLSADIQVGNETKAIAVNIPTGIKITGPTGWTGAINAPTIKNTTSVAPSKSGFTSSVSKVIEVGSSGVKLTFDKAVKITIPGETGKVVGYSYDGVTFNEITTACADNTQGTNDGLPAGGDCYYDDGTDMIIWTKHFTEFVTYTQTASSSSGSSASSSSGGGREPSADYPATSGNIECLSPSSCAGAVQSQTTLETGVENPSPEEKTTPTEGKGFSGITGAVIGTLTSAKGVGIAVAVLAVFGMAGLLLQRHFKLKKKQ